MRTSPWIVLGIWGLRVPWFPARPSPARASCAAPQIAKVWPSPLPRWSSRGLPNQPHQAGGPPPPRPGAQSPLQQSSAPPSSPPRGPLALPTRQRGALRPGAKFPKVTRVPRTPAPSPPLRLPPSVPDFPRPSFPFLLPADTHGRLTVFQALSWTVGYWVNETDAAPPLKEPYSTRSMELTEPYSVVMGALVTVVEQQGGCREQGHVTGPGVRAASGDSPDPTPKSPMI